MSEEEKLVKLLEKNAETLEVLLNEIVKDEEKKESILNLFDDLSTNFLISPASSRDSYHNSFYGGLYEHSLNVYKNLRKANEAFELGFTDQEMFVVALLHDFGKCVTANLKDPHYKDSEAWKKKKLGQGFEYDYADGYFTNRDRTMFVLQHYKVQLTKQEYQAILLNDGLAMDANRAYSMKEFPLAFWTQVADNWAAREEEKATKSNTK